MQIRTDSSGQGCQRHKTRGEGKAMGWLRPAEERQRLELLLLLLRDFVQLAGV